MIRAALPIFLSCLAAAIAAGWLLGAPAPLDARFAPGDCRRIILIDPATRSEITGAEDIVLAADGDTLILAAHDRLDTAIPEGGLYAVSLADLGGAADRVEARPLLARAGAAGPFRPHGLALSPDGARLAVVNRIAPAEGVVEVGTLGPDGWRPDRRIADPRLCRANDLDFAAVEGSGAHGVQAAGTPAASDASEDGENDSGAEVLRVTLDRADCTTSLRDLAGGTGSVARIRGDVLEIERSGLHFPNGIVGAWIAETRGHRLQGPDGPVPVPGGPDNLGMSDGWVIAALHPNLVRTGLYIAGWLDRLPTRIVAVEPDTGLVEVLYDNPKGTQFSGATVGVLAGGRLVAGSVRDAGILYCEAPGGLRA